MGIAHKIVFSVTNHAFQDLAGGAQAAVTELKMRGFRIAVGAGCIELPTLVDLQPDVVKLDATLVAGIDGKPRAQNVVRAMAGLCHELDVQLIADGVGTPGERDMLASLGCDLMRGDLFARPDRGLPPASF